MSTYVGYRCLSHATPIQSETWYNHGSERLAKVLANRNLVLVAMDILEMVSEPPEVSWLRQHRSCKVKVVDEYGQEYNADGEPIEVAS